MRPITFHNAPGASEQALVTSLGGRIKYTYDLVPTIATWLPQEAVAAPLAAATRLRSYSKVSVREIRRRSRVVGSFPDGQSALMLAAARLRYIAGTRWGTRQYMNMERLKEQKQEAAEAAA
jgi:hypothetical protein